MVADIRQESGGFFFSTSSARGEESGTRHAAVSSFGASHRVGEAGHVFNRARENRSLLGRLMKPRTALSFSGLLFLGIFQHVPREEGEKNVLRRDDKTRQGCSNLVVLPLFFFHS